MSEDDDFMEFLRRVRAGEAAAAEELVQRYEPLIRREVRLKLQDPGLCRLVDTSDICQSVMVSFFVRAAAGHFELNQPGHLLGLLIRIARNKVALAARHHRAQRRDRRRVGAVDVAVLDPAGDAPTPSRIVEARELLNQVRCRLSEDECRLADRRGQGQDWATIAAALGGTADGRRMQLTRALDRVARELGLEEHPL